MAKVFRIHKEGSGNIIDWAHSHSYGDNVIKQITDPFGAKATKEITSIPSPFSRIDLAVTAFKTVNEAGLIGTTIYHKMVSDCLDIGEIFFNAENFKDPRDHSKNKIEILVWDRAQEIEKLKKSPVREHRIVGETLDMYLNQDAGAYNFGRMDKNLKDFYMGKAVFLPDEYAQLCVIAQEQGIEPGGFFPAYRKAH